MDKISEIISLNPKANTSDWILKAAIKYPNCIILSKDMASAKILEKEYYALLSNENWFKQKYWKIFGRRNPAFSSVYSNLRGCKVPIIFDNDSIFTAHRSPDYKDQQNIDKTICPNCGLRHPLVAEFGYCGKCAEKMYSSKSNNIKYI